MPVWQRLRNTEEDVQEAWGISSFRQRLQFICPGCLGRAQIDRVGDKQTLIKLLCYICVILIMFLQGDLP